MVYSYQYIISHIYGISFISYISTFYFFTSICENIFFCIRRKYAALSLEDK